MGLLRPVLFWSLAISPGASKSWHTVIGASMFLQECAVRQAGSVVFEKKIAGNFPVLDSSLKLVQKVFRQHLGDLLFGFNEDFAAILLSRG